MKIQFLLPIVLLTAAVVQGQKTFQKTYGGSENDLGWSVQQTKDDGFILFGNTESFGVDKQDMYLIKTDVQGNELWSKTYGTENFEYGMSAQQTEDNGFIICGTYTGVGISSLTLIKTDAEGNEIWNKGFSDSDGRGEGHFVQQTPDGGYFAVGYAGLKGEEDVLVVKTDKDGNEEWKSVYTRPGRQVVYEVTQTNDGGFAMIGERNGVNGKDMFLMKIDDAGIISWTKSYGTREDEIGRSLFETDDNGFILLGYQEDKEGDIILIRTDELGNRKWQKTFGGSGRDMGFSVKQTSDGGFIMAGEKGNKKATEAHMYCIKTNFDGEEEWSNTYPKGILSNAHSVQETKDGGYVLLGSTTERADVMSEMYLVKINAVGTVSVNENSLPEVSINAFPNPFTDYMIMEINDPKQRKFSLSILSAQGQVVKNYNNLVNGILKIERNNLSSGLYLYKLTSEKGLASGGRFLIK